MGDVESGLEGRAQFAAYLELNSDAGALPYLINVPATFCLVATMLGIALLGLGLVMEKGFLPIWIGGLMLVSGLAGIPGVLALGEAGFLIWLVTLIAAVASGVVLLMRRGQEQ